VQVDTFAASWGQFVGVVPSRARVVSKVSVPVSLTDPEPLKALAENGIFTLSTNADIGVAWSQDTRALALVPATVDVEKVFALSAKASLANVPREAFATDPAQVMAAAFGVEIGSIEVSLRDQGGLDLIAAQLARGQRQPPQAGRAMLSAMLAQNAQAAPPELQQLYEAVGRFAQGSGETLTIRVAPRGRVPLMQLVEAARAPGGAAGLLGSFAIEATVGR
jgi:hypothetical protein